MTRQHYATSYTEYLCTVYEIVYCIRVSAGDWYTVIYSYNVGVLLFIYKAKKCDFTLPHYTSLFTVYESPLALIVYESPLIRGSAYTSECPLHRRGGVVYLQSVIQTLYINCVYVAGCLNHRPGNDWTCNVSVSLQNWVRFWLFFCGTKKLLIWRVKCGGYLSLLA